jgi:hypothetical protein
VVVAPKYPSIVLAIFSSINAVPGAFLLRLNIVPEPEKIAVVPVTLPAKVEDELPTVN